MTSASTLAAPYTGIVRPQFTRVAMISCIDRRLALTDAYRAEAAGGGFLIRMLGGGASLLNPKHAATTLDQFVEGYGVSAYEQFIIRLHLNCGKCLGLANDPSFPYSFDPTSVADLYALGDMAASLVHVGLAEAHGVSIPGLVEVARIEGTDEYPNEQIMPR